MNTPTLLEQIVAKHKEDRIRIKELKAKHAEELRVIEEFQSKREAALLELCATFDMGVFSYVTDLFINGREGKKEAEKKKDNIALDQNKLEHWLLKMLGKDGKGVKTDSGTVFKTRRESVTCADFELFVAQTMIPDAAKAIVDAVEHTLGKVGIISVEDLVPLIVNHMHLEYLTKAVRKESVLELMGEQADDGSRPNTPPAGVNYVAVQCIGVNKAK